MARKTEHNGAGRGALTRHGYPQLGLIVEGELIGQGSRKTMPVLNPASECVIGELPLATERDLLEAVEAAAKGYRVWRATAAFDRAQIMHCTAALLRQRADVIARILTLEEGKPLVESKAEILFAADVFDWYAEEGKRAYGRQVPSRATGVRQLVVQEGIGPCAAFTPWNFPALTPARKIAGALAAGCSCVIKPSEEVPGTALEIARACHDAGLPPGVLNVVFGAPDEVAPYLIRSPAIRKVSFTGSTSVGKEIAKLAACGPKPCTLELGGNAPAIVCEDVDPKKAAFALTAAKFRNAGQVCIAPNRFFVHESVVEQFTEAVIAICRDMRIGSGMLPETRLGPLANERRRNAMERFLDDAQGCGAEIKIGGTSLEPGFFFSPTVISRASDNMAVMREEVFGPIVPISPFATFDEVIDRANAVPHGLAGYAYTHDISTARRLADELQVGMLGINHTFVSTAETPFGGVKDSGYGREGGIEGLEAFLAPKLISEAAPVS